MTISTSTYACPSVFCNKPVCPKDCTNSCWTTTKCHNKKLDFSSKQKMRSGLPSDPWSHGDNEKNPMGQSKTSLVQKDLPSKASYDY